jgi:hypothetical protein
MGIGRCVLVVFVCMMQVGCARSTRIAYREAPAAAAQPPSPLPAPTQTTSRQGTGARPATDPLATDSRVLDATLTDDGAVLLATDTSLIRWDPKGASATQSTAVAPMFAAKTKGDAQELPDLRARFTEDGKAVAYSTATGANEAWSLVRVQTIVVDTATMQARAKLAKVVKLTQSPEYAVMASLSPNGKLLLLAHPTAVAVFDVASGKSLVHKEPAFSDGASFLDDNTVYVDNVPPGSVITVTTGASTPLPLRGFSAAPDNALSAAFDSQKKTLFVYDVATKKTRSVRSMPACDNCEVAWLDATHVRVLNRIARTSSVDVDVNAGTSASVPYAPVPVFTRAGFSAFEEYLDENTTNPLNVYFTTPEKRTIKLAPLQKVYRAAKDYLLVGRERWELYDIHGELVWSHKR